MSQSDDRSQDPWTDPQTHLDTDPVNAEQASDEPGADADPAPDPAAGSEDES